MKNFLAVLLCSYLAACSVPSSNPDTKSKTTGAAADNSQVQIDRGNYQYVGTYENFATPMGGSVSVLMAGTKKIKIASVDDTRYINIDTHQGIPAMRINGSYGINGNHKNTLASDEGVFIVREIEHLAGGLEANSRPARASLDDFFDVDSSASGPVTRSELNIRFPDSLKRYFGDDDLACFFEQVDIRAADMGDPETMPPIRRVLLTNSQMRWKEMTKTDKRLQLARYVTSMALSSC